MLWIFTVIFTGHILQLKSIPFKECLSALECLEPSLSCEADVCRLRGGGTGGESGNGLAGVTSPSLVDADSKWGTTVFAVLKKKKTN